MYGGRVKSKLSGEKGVGQGVGYGVGQGVEQGNESFFRRVVAILRAIENMAIRWTRYTLRIIHTS